MIMPNNERRSNIPGPRLCSDLLTRASPRLWTHDAWNFTLREALLMPGGCALVVAELGSDADLDSLCAVPRPRTSGRAL
jgi:hypothetical protein